MTPDQKDEIRAIVREVLADCGILPRVGSTDFLQINVDDVILIDQRRFAPDEIVSRASIAGALAGKVAAEEVIEASSRRLGRRRL